MDSGTRETQVAGASQIGEAASPLSYSVDLDWIRQYVTLSPDRQQEVVTRGQGAIVETEAEIKRQRQVERDRKDPCDVVAERWIKSIHDALVPVNSACRRCGWRTGWSLSIRRQNASKRTV